MPRDTLAITPQVLEHLKRAGIALPPIAPGEVTTDEYFAFWRALASRTAAPDLGLAMGRAVFGRSIASQAALHAPTVADAIRTIGRYKRLVCPEEIALDPDGGVRFDWSLATTDVPPLLIDAVFAANVALYAHATDGKARPTRLELARKPRHARLLAAHFQCPIAFNAPRDRIVFSQAALALPLATANRAAYADLLPRLEAQLAAKRSLLGDVRIAIARTMSGGTQPSIASIADRLRTSARTLQRRLGDAHTTFGAQLETVRHVTARRLLEHTELPPIDIAFLLGFAEPNSFARAFRSWERTSPLRWRAQRIRS